MTKLSAAKATGDGKVDESAGDSDQHTRDQRDAMTAHSATAARARTGGPQDDGPKILEHVAGWTLVAVIAMLVTQLGLL